MRQRRDGPPERPAVVHLARIGRDHVAGVGLDISASARRALRAVLDESHAIGRVPVPSVVPRALDMRAVDAVPGSPEHPAAMMRRLPMHSFYCDGVPEQGHAIHMPADSQEDDEHRGDGRQHPNDVVGARRLEPGKPRRRKEVEATPHDQQRGERDRGVEAGEIHQEVPAGVDAAVAKAVADSDDAEQHQQRQLDEPYPPEEFGINGAGRRKEKQIGRNHPDQEARGEVQRLIPRADATGCQVVADALCAD